MTDPRVRKDMLLTPLQQSMKVDEEESAHRAGRLAKSHTDNMQGAGPDASALPAHQRDAAAPANAHISEKFYFFPESFNALRRELEENWQNFFHLVNPEIGMSPAYAMVFDAPKFVGMCNGATDSVVQFDSQNIDGICKEFLNKFRAMRGVSAIH